MSPIAVDYFSPNMSEQAYLDSEPYSEVRREYIDGYVYAMAGANMNHNRLTGNVFGDIRSHLKGKKCEAVASDMRVKVGQNYFYPDVLVDCQNPTGYFTETPTIIVEVLSKSTRKSDKTIKFEQYKKIATLQEYVLIEQDFVEVTRYQRQADTWQQSIYYLGDDLPLDSINFSVSIAAIYDRVDNSDVHDWLLKQAADAAQAATQAQTQTQTQT